MSGVAKTTSAPQPPNHLMCNGFTVRHRRNTTPTPDLQIY